MKQFYQILADLRKRGVQRYLDEAEEMKQKLEEFFHVIEKGENSNGRDQRPSRNPDLQPFGHRGD